MNVTKKVALVAAALAVIAALSQTTNFRRFPPDRQRRPSIRELSFRMTPCYQAIAHLRRRYIGRRSRFRYDF